MNKYHQPLNLPADRTARLQRARAADEGCIGVGGLAARLGQLRGPAVSATDAAVSDTQRRAAHAVNLGALARLVQFARREAQQTPEQFARKLGIGTDELVGAESGTVAPEPRVLYAMSEVLDVSYNKLLILAGHRLLRNERLDQEGLRFAAYSAPMDKLSKDEVQALHGFLKVLHDD